MNMELLKGTGIYSIVPFGMYGYARVTVIVDRSRNQPGFEVNLNHDKCFIPPSDYIQAAREAVDYAFECAGVSKAHVVLNQVVSSICDISEGILAAAVAMAVWDALDYKPDQQLIEHMKDCLRTERKPDGYNDPNRCFPGFQKND